MSQRFGPGAVRLAGLAARALGWRPEDFWGATPAELVSILVPDVQLGQPMARDDLNRMMERDNDRSGRYPDA
ncbi:MAG: phage tail assembly chaperone [Novosphingobium sp.]|nr:phage tail assembly chaperone [Novosphingobium sp.]